MLKYYITVLLWKFTKTLNQILNLSRANENLEIYMPVLFEQLNESKKFWGISLDNALINRSYLKNAKQPVQWKLPEADLGLLQHPRWSTLW